jgi:hypothetical protein
MIELEAAIDAGIASLKANLPARIAAVNAATSDFDIPDIATEAYYPGGLAVHYLYPHVEVASPDWLYTQVSLAQVDFSGQATIMAMIRWQHYDYVTLFRGIMRYQKALVEALAQPDTFGAHVPVRGMRGFTRVANPEAEERQDIYAGALVVCTIELVDVRP